MANSNDISDLTPDDNDVDGNLGAAASHQSIALQHLDNAGASDEDIDALAEAFRRAHRGARAGVDGSDRDVNEIPEIRDGEAERDYVQMEGRGRHRESYRLQEARRGKVRIQCIRRGW